MGKTGEITFGHENNNWYNEKACVKSHKKDNNNNATMLKTTNLLELDEIYFILSSLRVPRDLEVNETRDNEIVQGLKTRR